MNFDSFFGQHIACACCWPNWLISCNLGAGKERARTLLRQFKLDHFIILTEPGTYPKSSTPPVNRLPVIPPVLDIGVRPASQKPTQSSKIPGQYSNCLLWADSLLSAWQYYSSAPIEYFPKNSVSSPHPFTPGRILNTNPRPQQSMFWETLLAYMTQVDHPRHAQRKQVLIRLGVCYTQPTTTHQGSDRMSFAVLMKGVTHNHPIQFSAK